MFGDLPVKPEDCSAVARQMEARAYRHGQGACRAGGRPGRLCRTPWWPPFPGSGRAPWWWTRATARSGRWRPRCCAGAGQGVVELYCTPDGAFPHRDPNPAVPEHLARPVPTRARDRRGDLGVAYDGDGDRVIFVDERGRVSPADRTLVLLIRHLLPDAPGAAVVYDLKSSSVVAEETLAAGRPAADGEGRGTPLSSGAS